jgi:hypothetical protein
MNKKILVIGVIGLFLGLAIAPSINAGISKINHVQKKTIHEVRKPVALLLGHGVELSYEDPCQMGPVLEIGNITVRHGLLCAVIKNIGDVDATDVEWEICLEGGIIIIPHNRCEGGNIEMIKSHGEVTVCRELGFVFGFGRIQIKVTASAPNANKATKTITVFLLGPLILGLP